MHIGEVINGRYEVVDLLGDGAQYTVAKAVDQHSGTEVTLKRLNVMPSDTNHEREVKRLHRAASLRVGHPAIPDPVEAFEENGSWYVVLPFVEAIELDIYVQREGGKLPLNRALKIFVELVGALEPLHAINIVHRDLKPRNILVRPDGHISLIDLGICKALNEPTITGNAGILGTKPWHAPEQAADARSVDHRADFYPLGLLLYFMLTGADIAQTIGDRPALQMLPPLRQVDATIPQHIEDLVGCLLQDQADARPSCASEILAVLQAGHAPAPSCSACGTAAIAGARHCHMCAAPFAAAAPGGVLCIACGQACDGQPACGQCGGRFDSASHGIEFNSGTPAGKTFRIPEGVHVVGRDQLGAQDPYISQRHFQLVCLNGAVHIQDAGSTNGTCINGALVTQLTPLQPGQEIVIAGYTARYVRSS